MYKRALATKIANSLQTRGFWLKEKTDYVCAVSEWVEFGSLFSCSLKTFALDVCGHVQNAQMTPQSEQYMVFRTCAFSSQTVDIVNTTK